MEKDNNTPILDAHGQALLEEFRERQPLLERLDKEAFQRLSNAIAEQGIYVATTEHRVKTEKSLIGKLELKGGKYHDIGDITDLVGIRIVTFFTDDVDRIAAIAKHVFDIDWSNSVDKRKLHQLTSFGYNSLHYVCHLPPDAPEELRAIGFELQMRTALQHVWSTIEHDTGYKGVVKILPEHRRQFSRLAGMLELVDDEFGRLRRELTDYRRQVQGLVKSGRLDEVQLSEETFRSYLELHPFNRLNQRIAAINQAEIIPVSLMSYLSLFESFGMSTLGDVQRFVDSNAEDAYQLAISQLAVTDLDIISESVGPQNLCIVHVLKQGGGLDAVISVFDMLNGQQDGNAAYAKMLLEQAGNMTFMNK